MKQENRGGRRKGAGRPLKGDKKKNRCFYLTDKEDKLLREFLRKLREENKNENDMS
jgi:hypothetical protein